MTPFPIPWKALGVAAALLGAFVWGAMVQKGRCDRAALALRDAQTAVVAQQQLRNNAELTHQLQVNQQIGADNAKLQADNNLANLRMHSLLRAYAAKVGGSALPGLTPSPLGTEATGQESGCTQHIGDLLEHVADLASAARFDSTELTLLQEWAKESGLE